MEDTRIRANIMVTEIEATMRFPIATCHHWLKRSRKGKGEKDGAKDSHTYIVGEREKRGRERERERERQRETDKEIKTQRETEREREREREKVREQKHSKEARRGREQVPNRTDPRYLSLVSFRFLLLMDEKFLANYNT